MRRARPRWRLSAALALVAATEAAFAAEANLERPDYGTKDRILTHVAFSDFVPNSNHAWVAIQGTGDQGYGIYSTLSPGLAYAVARVPSGALLTFLELDYYDANVGQDGVDLKLLDCDFRGTACTLLGELSSTGSAGGGFTSMDLTPKNYTVDNNTRELLLEVSTSGGDGSELFNGAYIGYKLQIGPAPATATFGDVPTAHLYFRAIEALAASGITAGCGSGNFCPNQNLTRGEMAAFLARALGLHFAN